MNDTNANEAADTNADTAPDTTATEAAEAPKTRRKRTDALNFESTISFRETVSSEEGEEVGRIVMPEMGVFKFVEVEGTTLTGAEHIAVGTRLAALEKAFSKLKLPE